MAPLTDARPPVCEPSPPGSAPAAPGFFRTPAGISSLLISFVVLLCLPSGTDYLYYYLPAAGYLHTYHAFPPRLLPSLMDAPFAYPPAEYLLLYASFLAGPFQGFVIRALMAAKVTLFFYLTHRISRHCVRPDLLLLAPLLPSLSLLLFLNSTDLNVILATQALILFHLEDRARLLATSLVAYALLSKYTFVPLYGLALVFFWARDRRKLPWLLIPLLPYAFFLARNLELYGNPVFPLLASRLNGLDDFQRRMLESWTGVKPGLPWLLRTVKGLCGGLVLLGLLARPGRDRLLTALVATYLLFWAVAMNPDNTGDVGRFVLPASLVVLSALAREAAPPGRTFQALLAGQVLLFWLTAFDRQQQLYGLFLLVCGLALPHLTKQPASTGAPAGSGGMRGLARGLLRAPVLAVALLALIGLARLAVKRSFDFGDLGYSPYREEHTLIRDLLETDETVLTDFYPLPIELRMHPKLVLEQSVLGGERYLELVRAGAPEGVAWIFIPSGSLEGRPWYHPGFRYREERRVRGWTLFRVERPEAPPVSASSPGPVPP